MLAFAPPSTLGQLAGARLRSASALRAPSLLCGPLGLRSAADADARRLRLGPPRFLGSTAALLKKKHHPASPSAASVVPRAAPMPAVAEGFVSFSAPASEAAPELPIVIETENVPIFLFTREIEQDALEQLKDLAKLPFATGFVSAMPDVHLGKGATVGSVFASEDAVIPNAVGVDIGCGMKAMPVEGLRAEELTEATLRRIQALVKERIPTGFESHPKATKDLKRIMDELMGGRRTSEWLKQTVGEKTACQIGTLGGGNHFIELCKDESGGVWLMLHSGSRNVGKTTAEHYNELAMQQMRKEGGEAARRATKDGLNWLRVDSREGQAYLTDMQWCQDYAMANRGRMMEVFAGAVEAVTGRGAALERSINIHHNFCACERCTYTDPRSGETVTKDLWVTRKGATSAKPGELGLIPGSMGVGSYVVRGRGSPLSWSSCSHGAGRRMSRVKAKEAVSQADFEAAMAGIVADTDPALRDEAPQAYKDLSQVMANQSSLVEVVHRLEPLLNVKGFGAPFWATKKKKKTPQKGLGGPI